MCGCMPHLPLTAPSEENTVKRVILFLATKLAIVLVLHEGTAS